MTIGLLGFTVAFLLGFRAKSSLMSIMIIITQKLFGWMFFIEGISRGDMYLLISGGALIFVNASCLVIAGVASLRKYPYPAGLYKWSFLLSSLLLFIGIVSKLGTFQVRGEVIYISMRLSYYSLIVDGSMLIPMILASWIMWREASD